MFLNYSIFKVEGNSMNPDITKGSYVLVNKNFGISSIFKRNCILVFKHNIYGNLIKKFEYEDRFRRLWFKGTSDMSISKKMIGPISKKNIIGKVILVIRKNGLLFNL